MRSILRALAGIMLLSLAGGPLAHAQTCVVPLVNVGPTDPVHGFPQYYIDSTNTALQPCLDVVCNPALGLPDPAAPVSFPNNFPIEVFYSRAIAKMTGPAGQTGLLVLALEGSFFNGTQVIPGDQIVFTRMRVRATGLTAGGTYTVTHPYGVETLQASSLGVINFTRDTGRVALQFQLALTGDVGPFLQFATGATPPPAGTIGNPAVDQTVTGSACGTNFFRIEGPGLPPGGMQTNLFNPVIGEIAGVCGNGVLEPGEQCDDGNTLNGDCCSATCTIDPAGTPCNDGNACTGPDACTGGTPTCSGAAINCNDGNVCTTDSCDPALGCQRVNNTIGCSDANACTVGDTCSAGTCVSGPAPNCDDGNACTVDGCSSVTGCTHSPVSCDDGNVCTTDVCDPVTGCAHVNNTAPCNDGNACTVGDVCSAGTCAAGAPANCDDNNPCTVDSCNPATGCRHTPAAVGTACDDGNPATKLDACTVNAQCIGVRLLAPLTRTAGEDPSVSATIRAAGDGRWNGTTARVRLANLDPRRYPANARCRVDVTAGSVSGTGTISNGVAPGAAVAVTNMDFLRNGPVRPGDNATVRIRCTVGGVTHDTSWQGKFAAP